jgi:hypothetical protein
VSCLSVAQGETCALADEAAYSRASLSEGKTPSTSELDLEHALKSSGSKSSN